MVKKIILRALNVISVILIVLSLFVLLSVVLRKPGEVPNVAGYSLFRVLTGSMSPTIPEDTLIVVKAVDPDSLKEGDVISFFSRDPKIKGQVNTHRIVGIEEIDGEEVFVTKGDANILEDQFRVHKDDVVGLMIASSKMFGKFVRLITNPLIFGCVIIIPLCVIIIMNMVQSIKAAARLAADNEDKEDKSL